MTFAPSTVLVAEMTISFAARTPRRKRVLRIAP